MFAKEIEFYLSYSEQKDSKIVGYRASPSLKFSELWDSLKKSFPALEVITIEGKDYELGEDDSAFTKTLQEIGIQTDTILELFVSQQECHGIGIGGMTAANLENSDKKQVVNVTSDPNCRPANCISKGLNIRGLCQSECVEKGKPVVHKIGYGKIDIIENLEDIKCPTCLKRIDGDTFLFFECKYQATGLFVEKGVKGKKTLNTQWAETKPGKCDRFLPDQAGTVNYLDLCVETVATKNSF